MTDIEKLAVAFEKQSSKLGPFAMAIILNDHELRAGTIKRAMRDLDITIDAAVGLIEGTHVVRPMEPTEEMANAGHEAISFVADAGSFRIMAIESYKAMIKAAQEGEGITRRD